ncbi:MAG: Gfo/Idh/MocA family oxidoreductase [Candidatus Hydrogenedentes bacterium]|nr:Gfo/Idh/MocA family oxidoreductase [Candidatus Hydrogenedentota bacterium]
MVVVSVRTPCRADTGNLDSAARGKSGSRHIGQAPHFGGLRISGKTDDFLILPGHRVHSSTGNPNAVRQRVVGESDLKVSSTQALDEIPAPELPWLPPRAPQPIPGIGLIGCGGITAYHLDAYRDAGFPVLAFCDVDEDRASGRRDTYNPSGAVYADYVTLLAHPGIEVVDIATHVEVRGAMIEAALRAGKHVLSQKPFTLDLAEGERLIALAEERNLKLAVNQNGRWAPHFSYMRQAIAAGVIGEVNAVHLAVHWDHAWTETTVFNDIPHLILYDFAIHWFDMLTCFMGDTAPLRVFASEARTARQTNKPPMLGQVIVEYPNAQATLVFDAATKFGATDHSFIAGTLGTLQSTGPDLSHQAVTLYNEHGIARPALTGEWFKNGFEGTMAELLCAIAENRPPANSARNNLRSLALCFAAIESARSHQPQVPGNIRRMPN